MSISDQPLKMLTALTAFVDAINCTGGIVSEHDGSLVPNGARDWPDLADAYFKACEALQVAPTVEDADDLPTEEEWGALDDDRPEHTDFDPGYGGTL
jgi:hypothetical protein